MKEWARKFYKSDKWQRLRAAKLQRQPYCERCLEKGNYELAVIVHHKKHLTPMNISNPEIALNLENLESLCLECHNDEHKIRNGFKETERKRRYSVDASGKLIF